MTREGGEIIVMQRTLNLENVFTDIDSSSDHIVYFHCNIECERIIAGKWMLHKLLTLIMMT